MQHIEDNEQIMLFMWAQLQIGMYPELELMHHIPNGGKRNAREAARLKQMGVKSGVPDIFLPVPRGGFHSLYIEMKAPRGTVSENQKVWLAKLSGLGYAAVICFGFEEARTAVLRYLGGEMTRKI